jgi:hypothetical protein
MQAGVAPVMSFVLMVLNFLLPVPEITKMERQSK